MLLERLDLRITPHRKRQPPLTASRFVNRLGALVLWAGRRAAQHVQQLTLLLTAPDLGDLGPDAAACVASLLTMFGAKGKLTLLSISCFGFRPPISGWTAAMPDLLQLELRYKLPESPTSLVALAKLQELTVNGGCSPACPRPLRI
jgi:hypothetical protein